MATTTNYNWTKPTVGGDANTWGTELNTDLDGIDTTVFAVSGVANAALPKAGGTLTGVLNEVNGSDIASAGTINLTTATGNYVQVTGTTTITAITLTTGARRVVKFTGALTLTYNASSLILPGAANITTAAGDTAEFWGISGGVICTQYTLGAGGFVGSIAESQVTNLTTDLAAKGALSGTNNWTGQNTFSDQVNGPYATVTDSSTINWNVQTAQVGSVTLGGNRTVAAPTNLVAGGSYALFVKQDATGSRTLTWNSVFKWPGGTAPTLSTAANAVDIISFISDGTNLYGVAQKAFS